jgi:hypothetical protein
MDGFCEVCDAEPPREPADLPPAVPRDPPRTYRMADVIEEIRRIRTLTLEGRADGDLRSACDRLEDLLNGLHRQFLTDVVVGHPSATD